MVADPAKYLFDILDCIKVIEAHTANIRSLSEYEKDLKTIDAVERRLAIIGEALNKAIKADPQIEVSNQRKIIGLRHLLIHDYDMAEDSIIWTIVQAHLPI